MTTRFKISRPQIKEQTIHQRNMVLSKLNMQLEFLKDCGSLVAEAIKTNRKLFLFIFIFTFCLLGFSTKAEDQQKDKEPFYSQLNKAVIRLEPLEGGGTAFFVRSRDKLFVVTARHVAEQNHDLHARVQCKNRKTGKIEVILLKLPRDRWVYHPYEGDEHTHYADVAAMRIRWIKDRSIKYFRYEPKDSKEHQKNQLCFEDPDPPRTVLVFGFPLDIGFELLEQKPFGRLGIVSMCTSKKFLKVRINNTHKFAEERACLIDVEAFPGNSGSPVINQLMPIIDTKIKLLGLLIASNTTMDFAVIEPVSRIRETLEIAKEQSVQGLSCWFLYTPTSDNSELRRKAWSAFHT